MTYTCGEKISRVTATLIAAWFMGVAACTPATPDDPLPASGGANSAAAGSPSVTGGADSSVSGGQATAGGAPPVATAGGGGTTEIGGAPPAAGGSVAAGGANPAGGAPAGGTGPIAMGGSAGTSAAAVGCNWVQGSNNSWTINPPAADKQVLFDGKSLSQWHPLNKVGVPAHWRLIAPDAMEVVPDAAHTNLQSNAVFSDVCLHVEYWTPAYSSSAGIQDRGNSGVYLKSAYEMQVLDTSLLGALIDGCGSVYKVKEPMVVACTQRETWNSYDIEFKGSVWDGKIKTKNAVFVQVALNGKIVQQNVTLNPNSGFTEAGIPDAPGPQPIALQDHKEFVRFRNIWAAVPKY